MTPVQLLAGRLPPHARRRRLDLALAGATVTLIVIGLAFVSIATAGRIDPSAPHVIRQAVAVVVGGGIAGVLTMVDHRRVALIAPLLYGATLLLLVLVLVVGPPINGARAWLVFGPLRLQPSELAKVALIVLLASLTHERREPGLSARGIGEVLAVAAVPMALILAQPDFGTFLVFVALIGVLLLVGGARVRHLLALAALGLAAVGLAWQLDLVKDHQVERVASFLDAGAADPRGAGYNTAQAQIAIGAGGLTGRGLESGRQAALGFVPENHTDFIFTVVGEETGFVGAMVVLGCYAIVLWRGLVIAAGARDVLGTLIAAGVVATIAVQTCVGVGMTVGLVPVVGLPLPLVSYGGTSVVASLAMIGLLQSVHRSAR
ncbi:MAG TPA: rod shape-determining protein RodA [Euzebyales bacterium]|nr:rod shape-determining protein RodA [Euzebyales bacterium]